MIGRSSDGRYRVIRREIVYNEEGYPLFATTIGEPGFETKKDARSHARAEKMGEVGGV
jgi:hypothetical protein